MMTRGAGQPLPLTDTGTVTVSGLQFQITPYNATGNTNMIPI
jgi:hypothetical protein